MSFYTTETYIMILNVIFFQNCSSIDIHFYPSQYQLHTYITRNKRPQDHSKLCATCPMVDMTAPYHTVVWAQSLYMQETSVDRERATGPRYSLDSYIYEPSDAWHCMLQQNMYHRHSDLEVLYGPIYSTFARICIMFLYVQIITIKD